MLLQPRAALRVWRLRLAVSAARETVSAVLEVQEVEPVVSRQLGFESAHANELGLELVWVVQQKAPALGAQEMEPVV